MRSAFSMNRSRSWSPPGPRRSRARAWHRDLAGAVPVMVNRDCVTGSEVCTCCRTGGAPADGAVRQIAPGKNCRLNGELTVPVEISPHDGSGVEGVHGQKAEAGEH